MKTNWKAYRLVGAVLAVNLILTLVRPDLALGSAVNAGEFILDILKILPPVLVLMGLFDVWVSRATVEENVGPGSGAKGVLLSLLLGTAAAGPLYAAFPVALSLLRKGARVANVVIFLGAFAAIKVPMLLLESSFVGLRFSLVRFLLTVPGVVLTGYLMERMVPLEQENPAHE